MELALSTKYIALNDNWGLADLQSYFYDHHRLGVFARKGTACLCCGVNGTRIVQAYEYSTGDIHIDLYTDNGLLISVDHNKAKANGGSEEWDNKDPMCFICNHVKANQDITLEELRDQVVEAKYNEFLAVYSIKKLCKTNA